MRVGKRYFMQTLLLASLTVASLVQASNAPEILLAKNLLEDAQTAAHEKLPLLLMFSADECPYCITVEEQFLKPMVISGDYRNKVLMRKVMLGAHPSGTDFDGQQLNADALAQRYNVFVTPTVVFVNDKGEEIAERLVGINTVDYYGAYLDQSIDAALSHMENKVQ